MTHTSEASRGLASRARSYAFPVIAFVVWRVVQLAILLSFGGQSALKQTTGFLPISHPGFFLWDGAWYQRIMDVGYRPIAGGSQQPASFFPLLPWMTRAVRVVIRSELGAAILVTTVASFAAVVLVYEVMRRWKGEAVARWAIVLLLAFPTSFFLWEFYTEALFIALTAGALLAMMRRAVWLAGILGGLATMARPTGILVLLVLAVMYLEQRRGINRDVLWLVLCACGIGVVMLVMKQQTGSALAFTRGSEAWGRHLTVPWDRSAAGGLVRIDGLCARFGARRCRDVPVSLPFPRVSLAALAVERAHSDPHDDARADGDRNRPEHGPVCAGCVARVRCGRRRPCDRALAGARGRHSHIDRAVGCGPPRLEPRVLHRLRRAQRVRLLGSRLDHTRSLPGELDSGAG